MNFSFLKRIVFPALVLLFSLSTYAEPAEGDFQILCTNAWMKKADEAKDKLDYKNFGEKYCGCAAKLPLDNDAAVQKAVRMCMSRTLLHDSMDSLEDDVGLDKVKDTDISNYCMSRWNLVESKPSDEDKKLMNDYCQCAKSKLMEVVRKANKMTDKQYDDEINTVADACADNAVTSTPEESKQTN